MQRTEPGRVRQMVWCPEIVKAQLEKVQASRKTGVAENDGELHGGTTGPAEAGGLS